MANDRQSYTKAEEIALLAQVERRCPLCGNDLFSKKNGKTFKAYELAHIFPLNPTLFEGELLNAVPRLHDDINHPDNLIPLCPRCHRKFDKPRTIEEYEALHAIKVRAQKRAQQQELQIQYPIEIEIGRVIASLYSNNEAEDLVPLEYDPKKVEKKFDSTMPRPMRLKIKHAVADYYQYIKRELLQIERESPSASELIAAQVKMYYLKQRSLGLQQPEVFENMVDWIRVKTSTTSLEAAEVVASYYVQNCEVFE